MTKLLWIGDAACDSGFARATHETLACRPPDYSVSVLGINYRGDPHNFPYPIYPSYVLGCDDFLGTDRIKDLVEEIQPNIVVIQNDPWNFPRYMRVLKPFNLPVVGIVAVDGKNCAGHLLNDLSFAIFWTQFGADEARAGGYRGPSTVIPLGVDLGIYHPMGRQEARLALDLPENLQKAYIVGNVNRNQPRKRLDLTVDYFCQWVKDYKVDDAFLFVHIAPTGEYGYNCEQLMKYYGLNKRLIRSDPGVWHGIQEGRLATVYNSFDTMITTTQGEGFGLTTLEGMACGIPQIVPQWSALGEWAKDGALQVPCTTHIATPGSHNPIGGVMDREQAISSLHQLYSNSILRDDLIVDGLKLANLERYRWYNIGNDVFNELQQVLSSPQSALQTA